MDFRAAHPVTPPHMSLFGSEATAVAAAAASGLPGLSPLSLLHHHSAAAAAPFAGSLYPGGKLELKPVLLMRDIKGTKFGCSSCWLHRYSTTAHKISPAFHLQAIKALMIELL